MGVPPNHPFIDWIFPYKPSILGVLGGDFTRSWLSLPLSHSTKVKGGKNAILGLSNFFQTHPAGPLEKPR